MVFDKLIQVLALSYDYAEIADTQHRSLEAEAREVLADSLKREPVTIVDLLSMDEGAEIEFEPERFGPDRPNP